MKLISGNPAVLGCLALAAFVAGGVWYVQGLRLSAVQSAFDDFVSTTKAQGVAAQKEAEAKAKAKVDRQLKESSDREYQTAIAALRALRANRRERRARMGRTMEVIHRTGALSIHGRPDIGRFSGRQDAGFGACGHGFNTATTRRFVTTDDGIHNLDQDRRLRGLYCGVMLLATHQIRGQHEMV